MDKKSFTLLRKAGRNTLTVEERAYLRKKDILWEPEPMPHAELVRHIKELALKISLEKAAKAFLYSVSTGDFQYRTALASLLWARALPEHDCQKKHSSWDASYDCCVCGGEFSAENDRTKLNMLRYTRHRILPESKYMDVSCAGYVLQDLHAFQMLPEVTYCDEDFRILNRILGLAKEISPTNKVNALLGLITADKSFDLTRANAYSILGVLSACGVFDTPEQKSYVSGFTNWNDCQFMAESDMYYPLNLWRGKHGINYNAIAPVFGAEIAQRLTSQTVISGSAEREPQKKTASDLAAEEFFKGFEMPVQLDDRMRYYYGLSPMDPAWDKVVIVSLRHLHPRYTELYFEGDTIRKMVHVDMTAQRKLIHFQEIDMDAQTDDRRMLLPKTAKGRPQTLTPSHLMVPTYMQASFSLANSERMQPYAFNCSNDQQLPLPYADLKDASEFAEYTEKYIASCPEEYHKVLENFRNKKRVSVKYTAGDIFRVQITPNLYTYCLILGNMRKLCKWKELPEGHPFHQAMSQPVIFRQYALITENAHMTAKELQDIPLLKTQLAQDNEILWETYPIVCRKELEVNDVDFGFRISGRLMSVAWGLTCHTFVEDPCGIFSANAGAEAFVCHDGKTGRECMTCGVGITIRVENGNFQAGTIPCPAPANAEVKKRLAAHFGFDAENACDAFAEMFGGLTRAQFIQLAKERFKY